ncbi:MAG: class I SAM-dependent methyltransferase [Chloroflexi bacterium]|nr:class I SAM-dependent methyltransferase [Chloroflexota bacterium]
MGNVLTPGNRSALRLFPPIASDYERWSTLLSLGQDPRWRAELVARLQAPPGARVLDVAAGTGLVTRLLQAQGHDVVSLDLSVEMLGVARRNGAATVLATAEALPFPDGSFSALTFGYLLRYVEPPVAMRELARVLRPGGVIGMVEFGRPRGVWRPWWWLYTRLGLPAAGLLAGRRWSRVGAFLGPSIDRFARRFPDPALIALWHSAGFEDVQIARRSLGGGLLMWARRS